MIIGDGFTDEYSYVVHSVGYGTTGDPDEECEAVRLLHDAVEEVTGKRIEPPVKPKMGFY